MSFYLPHQNAVHVHIAHTGGTWVGTALKVMGILKQTRHTKTFGVYAPPWMGRPKHIPMRYIYSEALDGYNFFFSFVRHPLSYYESIWNYYRQHSKEVTAAWISNGLWESDRFVTRHFRSTFNEWIEVVLEKEPGFVTRVYEQFLGMEGAETCQYIGRMETLREDFAQVMSLLGLGWKVEQCKDEIERLGIVRHKKSGTGPPIKWATDLRLGMEKSERLAIERFYGPKTLHKRAYGVLGRDDMEPWQLERMFPNGVPEWARNPFGANRDFRYNGVDE